MAGVPWVRGQRPSEAKLQPWKDGDRWVLPTRPDGEPCCEGIIAALGGAVVSSDGTSRDVRLADYAPTDVGSAASEGLSPVTASESSDSGAVSDVLRTGYTDQVVSANHFNIPPVPPSSGPVSCYSQSAGPVSSYKEGAVSAFGKPGAITAPQPGSDPSAQFGGEKKKGPAHWNLYIGDLTVQCVEGKCQVHMGIFPVLLIEPVKDTEALRCSALAPIGLKGQRRTSFLDVATKKFRAQMGKKTTSGNWGHSEEVVERFAEAMQEA